MDPGPLTWRELLMMSEGRARLEWAQSSVLMEFAYAAVRPEKAPVLDRDDFNPYSGKHAPAADPAAGEPLPKVNFGFISRKRAMKPPKVKGKTDG